MEADGNSGACGYCEEYGHQESDCRWRKTERKLDLAICFFVGLFLMPLALIGAVAGAAWSALRAGFTLSANFWDRWKALIRGPKGDGS